MIIGQDFLTKIIYALIIVFVFLIFKNLVTNFILKLLKKLTNKYKLKGIALMIDSIERPLKTFFIYTGIYFALLILPFNIGIKTFLYKIYRTCIIISITQCLLNIVSAYSIILGNTIDGKNHQMSKTIFPLLSKLIKVLILIIAVVAVAVEFDFRQLNSILAGVGIGGAALALASQDLIKNFFGGFIVLTDKSFNVGDWIKVEGTEGTVEELGLRSTKIRTIGKELVVVPNSRFTDTEVVNFTNRENRRASFILGATYDTSSSKLQELIDKIKNMLDTNPMITEGSVLVKFDGFGDSSLNIVVHYLTNTADYTEFMNIKDIINFKIMEIFEELQVEFAFPSVSVYMEKNN